MALPIALSQSKASVAAVVGLITHVDETFSNDSSRLLVSASPSLLCRSIGKVDIWSWSRGFSASNVPPSEERETE